MRGGRFPEYIFLYSGVHFADSNVGDFICMGMQIQPNVMCAFVFIFVSSSVCVLVTTLLHYLHFAPVLIMGKTKKLSLKPLVGQDRGGRSTLGSKAKFVRYMRMSGFFEAETKEALKDLNVHKQRRSTLMRDHFHALPAGSRAPTPSHEEYLVTMGSLNINGFIPWSAVPKPCLYPSCLTACRHPLDKKHKRGERTKVTWADMGEDNRHDYPRRSFGVRVHEYKRKLWWDAAHIEGNKKAGDLGHFNGEINCANANIT